VTRILPECSSAANDAAGFESGGKVWGIDDLRDRRLILAEVELNDPSDVVALPDWLAAVLVRHVTADESYGNAQLAK
jgi:CYTH domain-containing protein